MAEAPSPAATFFWKDLRDDVRGASSGGGDSR
jgi:hypothetical protein